MSLNAAEIGRVQSIKSKFENLNTLESLDIPSMPSKCHRPLSKFLFKRSSTAIDIPIKRNHETNGKLPTINGSTHPICTSTKNYLRRHNELDEPVIVHTINKKRSLIVANAEDTLKPLKEIKENVEMRLSRHTNDPVKRSSIKRSPAFRVGDKSTSNSNSNSNHSKCDKVNGEKNHVQSTVQRTLDESSKKFDAFLKRCNAKDSQPKLQETGMTDTLKAYLRQPLPSGPPPKKPPRTFCDAPLPPNTRAVTKRPTTAGGDVQQKIDLLKSKLILKPMLARKPNESTLAIKEKIQLSGSLLNCIPCSTASNYDSVIVSERNHSTKTTRLSRDRIALDATSGRKTMPSFTSSQTTVKRSSNGRSNDEPVYMEPFAHLRGITNAINVPAAHASHSIAISESSHTVVTTLNHSTEVKLSSSMSNGSLDGGESLGSSLLSNCTSCMADDHTMLDSYDIHYMVSGVYMALQFNLFVLHSHSHYYWLSVGFLYRCVL